MHLGLLLDQKWSKPLRDSDRPGVPDKRSFCTRIYLKPIITCYIIASFVPLVNNIYRRAHSTLVTSSSQSQLKTDTTLIMAFINSAAYLTEARGKLGVSQAPYPTSNDHELVIKVSYIAISPVEYEMIDYGFAIRSYPTILGSDALGRIVAVGSSITKFHEGDRVITHGMGVGSGDSRTGAYQE